MRFQSTKELLKVQKIAAILCYIDTVNKFLMEQYGDHSLAASVQAIQERYGVKISREYESVPNRFTDKPAIVKRYWLDAAERQCLLDALCDELINEKKALNRQDAMDIIYKQLSLKAA